MSAAMDLGSAANWAAKAAMLDKPISHGQSGYIGTWFKGHVYNWIALMSFPQTSLTLMQRLASGGNEEDWRVFFEDYWGAVCRFSLSWGAWDISDAEDVSAQTFEALWEDRLLVRWMSNRSAKLRTLLCAVARNILSQRGRVQSNRDRLFQKMLDGLAREERNNSGHVDAFYAAWVEDVLQRALESLAAQCYRDGKGNHIRVFYGRICRRLTIAKMADTLGISNSAVDHYFRYVRDRLAENIEKLIRTQVQRYVSAKDFDAEYKQEWARFGEYLRQHGGLEEAVRRAYDLLDPIRATPQEKTSFGRAVDKFTTIIRSSSAGQAPS